jgi:hypothetical protein
MAQHGTACLGTMTQPRLWQSVQGQAEQDDRQQKLWAYSVPTSTSWLCHLVQLVSADVFMVDVQPAYKQAGLTVAVSEPWLLP